MRTVLNVFRYITFRTGGAIVTGALFVFLFGPWIIDHLRIRQGKGLGWHDDPATLKPGEVANLLRAGDVVVVKGSKKMFWVNKFVPGLVAALQAKA